MSQVPGTPMETLETPAVRKYHEQQAEAERAYELAKQRAWGYKHH